MTILEIYYLRKKTNDGNDEEEDTSSSLSLYFYTYIAQLNERL